jgi:hypothetical protein
LRLVRIRISVEEAFAKYEAGDVTFIDQLSTKQDLRATAGSGRDPHSRSRAAGPARRAAARARRDLLLHLTARRPERPCGALPQEARLQAWALEGGLDAWIEAGHPTEERFSDSRENRD